MVQRWLLRCFCQALTSRIIAVLKVLFVKLSSPLWFRERLQHPNPRRSFLSVGREVGKVLPKDLHLGAGDMDDDDWHAVPGEESGEELWEQRGNNGGVILYGLPHLHPLVPPLLGFEPHQPPDSTSKRRCQRAGVFFFMTYSRRKLVAGNWKMNGSLSANRELMGGIKAGLGEFKGADVVVCVPSAYIPQVVELGTGTAIAVGAQTVSEHASGAYTGELSAGMLKELGCTYVIVGHSERRTLFGETSGQVAAKCAAVLAAGMHPVLCVGETLAERESGTTEAVVAAQLDAALDLIGAAALARGIVAYEPVWAIGTGKTATPEQAQAVHAFIRTRVSTRDAGVAGQLRILYGGSVKAGNARTLFSCADIDGGLVGGASLQAQEFVAICKAAD